MSLKTYVYKLYDSGGTFIADITSDVTSPFSLPEELNTAGGQIKIDLARPADDFGEGTEIDFNFQIKVYVEDGDTPNGTLVFTGYIADYTPIFGDDEHVELIVLSYGAELDEYPLKADESVDVSQLTGAALEYFGGTSRQVAQSFIPTVSSINSIDIKVGVFQTTDVTLALHNDASGVPAGAPITDNATVTRTISDTSATVNRFTFPSPVTVTAGALYWIVLN